jgi:hypothetical protein
VNYGVAVDVVESCWALDLVSEVLICDTVNIFLLGECFKIIYTVLPKKHQKVFFSWY